MILVYSLFTHCPFCVLSFSLSLFMYFHFTAYVTISYLFMFVVLSFSLRDSARGVIQQTINYLLHFYS